MLGVKSCQLTMSITAVGPSGAPRATAVEDRIELVEPSGRTLSLSLQKSDLAEDQRIGALLFLDDGTLIAGCARGRVHAFAQHGDLKFSRQFVPCGPISAIKRWPNNELAILHEDAVCLLRRADDDFDVVGAWALRGELRGRLDVEPCSYLPRIADPDTARAALAGAALPPSAPQRCVVLAGASPFLAVAEMGTNPAANLAEQAAALAGAAASAAFSFASSWLRPLAAAAPPAEPASAAAPEAEVVELKESMPLVELRDAGRRVAALRRHPTSASLCAAADALGGAVLLVELPSLVVLRRFAGRAHAQLSWLVGPARSSLLAIYCERSGGVLEVWSPDRPTDTAEEGATGAAPAAPYGVRLLATRVGGGAALLTASWPPRCYVLNDAAQDTVVALREVVAAEGGVQLVEANPSNGELVEAKADAGGSSDGDPCERALRLLEAGQDGAAETVLLSVRGDLPLSALAAPLLDLARRRLSALVATRDLVTLVALPPDVLAWVRAAAPADAAALPSSEYAVAASVGSLLARVDREVRRELVEAPDEAVALLEGLRCAREVLAMFQRPP